MLAQGTDNEAGAAKAAALKKNAKRSKGSKEEKKEKVKEKGEVKKFDLVKWQAKQSQLHKETNYTRVTPMRGGIIHTNE